MKNWNNLLVFVSRFTGTPADDNKLFAAFTRRYQGNLDDKADKYIHFAADGASRMQNLINDLLEFSLSN